MAKTFTAAFAQTPKTWTAVVTDAATDASDSPAGVVELCTAGPEGAILTSLAAIPRATVTASSLRLFLSKDGGTTMALIDSQLMGATTVNNTTAIKAVFFDYGEVNPLRLEAGDRLYVGSAVAAAGGIVFVAQTTDY